MYRHVAVALKAFFEIFLYPWPCHNFMKEIKKLHIFNNFYKFDFYVRNLLRNAIDVYYDFLIIIVLSLQNKIAANKSNISCVFIEINRTIG